MVINETLRMLRTINGVTGKELAGELGISTSYLSEIENGKKMPPFDMLQKYTSIFHVKLSTLVLFMEQEGDDQTSKITTRTKTKDALFRFMKFLDRMEQPDEGD